MAACGSESTPAAGGGGSTADGSIEASGRDDAGTTDPPRDAGLDVKVPSDAVFPACYSASLDKKLFPCAATGTCVLDCAACPTTTINCVGSRDVSSGPSCHVPSELADRRCVARCDDCSFPVAGSDAGFQPGRDVCSNTCIDLASATCNCGKCGNAVKVTPQGAPVCSGGHFCKALPTGGITSYSECGGGAPGLCCVGACSGIPVASRARLCVAPE
ncbi:MAG: hypothetical protein HOO96_44100 [Polyangiaceae bacterium]|nr:hypothetical protein [Polyangiaceae bacterium]